MAYICAGDVENTKEDLFQMTEQARLSITPDSSKRTWCIHINWFNART